VQVPVDSTVDLCWLATVMQSVVECGLITECASPNKVKGDVHRARHLVFVCRDEPLHISTASVGVAQSFVVLE
jgi:hypothetical protein